MSDTDKYSGDSQVPTIDSVDYPKPKDGCRYYVVSVDQDAGMTIIEAPSSELADKYARAYFGSKYKSTSMADKWQIKWVIRGGGRIHQVSEELA